MSQIKFKNTCYAQGRNGISKQIGVDIYPTSRINESNVPFNIVILTPINSYDQLTNGWLEVEMEQIPELIKQLQYFYDNYPKP